MPQELRTHVINLKSLDQDISDPIIAGGGDVNGRTLRVILTQEAWAQMTSDTKIYLKWRHKQLDVRGYNVLRQVSEEPCVWEINWPSAMLRKGDVLACLELVDKISISPTMNFIVHVLEDPIGNSGFKNEDDWSEFQKAVLRLQDLEEKIKRIESLEMGETLHDYVSDYTIGDVQRGDVIPKGRTFDQFVRHLVTNYQGLRYESPTISDPLIYTSVPLTVGTQGTISFSFSFNQNDAGPIKKIAFYCENDDAIQLTYVMTQEGGGPSQNIYAADISFMVPDKLLKFYAEVEYEDGPVKIDKFGENVPGQIKAGKIRSDAVKFSAKRFILYYYFTTTDVPSDLSDNFPDMGKLSKVEDLIQGDTAEFSSSQDSGNLVVYIPRDVLSDPDSRKPQVWRLKVGVDAWPEFGDNPAPISDTIVEPLGYYRYHISKPDQMYVYQPAIRIEL